MSCAEQWTNVLERHYEHRLSNCTLSNLDLSIATAWTTGTTLQLNLSTPAACYKPHQQNICAEQYTVVVDINGNKSFSCALATEP